MSERLAVVVGGGIGGLAAGAALARSGWAVRVLERAPSLEPVGAGIALWPNALRALDSLGVGDDVRAKAAFGGPMGVRRPDGRWLARTDFADELRHRFGDPLVVLPRPELTDLLAGSLPSGALTLGAAVRSVVPGDDGRRPRVVVHDEELNDEEVEADLVVAADGIGSPSRERLFPDHPGPVYAGYTTWRLIAALPKQAAGWETWGRDGQRFACVPMADGAVYCYATANTPAGVRHDDELAELRSRFGDWHEPIPRILAGLSPGQVLHHDVFELRQALPTFARGRVVLVGDAAHAMTPELGQGGCLALEDAVTLGVLLRDVTAGSDDLDRVLDRYAALRLSRTTALARRSRSAGRMNQASSPLALRARRLGARLTALVPPRLLVRGLAPVVDWRPPG